MLAIRSFSTPLTSLFFLTLTTSTDSCTMPQRYPPISRSSKRNISFLWFRRWYTFDLPFGLGGMVSPAAQVALSRPNRAALLLPANGGRVEQRSRGISGRRQVERHSRSRVKQRSCAHAAGSSGTPAGRVRPGSYGSGGAPPCDSRTTSHPANLWLCDEVLPGSLSLRIKNRKIGGP